MDFASPFLLALLRLNRTKHRLTKYASLYSIASLSATSMQQLVHHKTKNLLFSQIRASEGMRHLIHNGVLCGFSAVDRSKAKCACGQFIILCLVSLKLVSFNV